MIVNDDVKFELAYRRMVKRSPIMSMQECLEKVRGMREEMVNDRSGIKAVGGRDDV